MVLYLYCSYTHSSRGFVLTRLEDEGLVSANLSAANGKGQEILERFFMYDDFRILWQEYGQTGSFSLFPATDGCVFGIRGLRGRISDRDAVINFGILAESGELETMDALARRILSDMEGFALALSGCLSIGGGCGYQGEAEKLRLLLKQKQEKQLPGSLEAFLNGRGKRTYSVRDQLVLAVCCGTWEQAAEHMGPGWLWKRCPRQAVSQQAFGEMMGTDSWR